MKTLKVVFSDLTDNILVHFILFYQTQTRTNSFPHRVLCSYLMLNFIQLT